VIALVERGSEKSARRLQRDIGIDVALTPPNLAALNPARSTPGEPGASKPSAERRTGTVKFFHDGRGYGFIDIGARADVFVHHTNARGRLTTGQRVEFALRQGRKGVEAFDVAALDARVPVA
jgi:CspA family cold shock protein